MIEFLTPVEDDHFLRGAPAEPLFCDWFIPEHFTHLGYQPLAECGPVMSQEDGENIIDLTPSGFVHFMKIPRGRDQIAFGNAVGSVIIDQSLSMRFTSINARYVGGVYDKSIAHKNAARPTLHDGDGYIMLTKLSELAKLKMLILQVTEDYGYRFR
jgi:hypothetical protein